MGRFKDLVGESFGRLTVHSLHSRGEGSVRWLCTCSCGNIVTPTTRDLRSGNTKSCGCARKESLRRFNTTHGMSDSRLYRIYRGMLTRCLNCNSKYYDSYGGRGIAVSEDWVESFENFHKDMEGTYVDDATLERIDVNGNYCKENCMWVAKKEQALNKTLYKNNKTGYTGVSEEQRKYGATLVATIQNPATGKAVVKTRNLTKYTREDALHFLLEWLKCKREEFGYKETHGSGKHIEE